MKTRHNKLKAIDGKFLMKLNNTFMNRVQLLKITKI